MQEQTSQIIKTIGEQGEEILMRLQEIVTVNDRDYALLSLVKEDVLPNAQNDEADELILMKMNKTDDECTFEIIEDDDEFNFVAQAITDDEDENNEDEEN